MINYAGNLVCAKDCAGIPVIVLISLEQYFITNIIIPSCYTIDNV